MATSKVSATEGTGKNIGTYSITEDASTKEIQRNVLNNSSGTEIGTTSNPVQVSVANTGANATAIKVDGSAATQPVSDGGSTLSVDDGAGSITVDNGGTFAVQAAQSGTWTVQPGNTANTTAWLVSQTPATSGGLSIYSGSIAATATEVKASAGQVYGWYIYNSNASVAYVQFFNVASGSVTLGTTAPTFSIGIPATSGANVSFTNGIAFGTAIAIAATTTRAGSTGPGSTVDINVFYK